MALRLNLSKFPPHIRLLFGAQLVVTGLLFAYRFRVVGAKAGDEQEAPLAEASSKSK